jgi:hypothetical protein
VTSGGRHDKPREKSQLSLCVRKSIFNMHKKSVYLFARPEII